MKRALGLLAATAFAAQRRRVSRGQDPAIVVKGLDNPFFEQIHRAAEGECGARGIGLHLPATGLASSADEAGEVQIVDDLITKGVAAIAISPSNAPMMATC
jgi:ribose transport system substrate-binding protein